MALVCDFKSDATEEKSPASKEEAIDLEDGEIEDDEEETPPNPPSPPPPPAPPVLPLPPVPVPQDVVVKPEFPVPVEPPQPVGDRMKPIDKLEREKMRERGPPIGGVRPDKRKHDEKGKRHMTEAEKSILHLRKREEAQRKKWEKMNRNREVDPADDDFAKNIEKTLATILNKKEKEAATAASSSDDRDKDKSEWERDEEIRGKKRRKNEIKDRKNKQHRFDFPMSDTEDPEMPQCPPDMFEQPMEENTNHSIHSEDSYESEDTSDRNRIDERMKRREKKMMKRKRDRGYGKDKQKRQKKKNNAFLGFDPRPICVFYMQGKCVKSDCNFSHMVNLPMKMEVCKFYLNSCCAKGDKCSYMHSEFPCKFYHTGLTCTAGDDCKFSHGKPLSDSLKQVLFKHIETAPREILGGFPRVSREEALSLVDVAQNKLQEQDHSGAEQDSTDKGEEAKRPVPKYEVPREIVNFDAVWTKASRNNQRWQDWKPPENLFKPFNSGKDQDMRVNSNGDIDMRTLPPPPLGTVPSSDLKKDVDIRKIPEAFSSKDSESERRDESESGDNDDSSLPKTLPKTQRDLFLRIQSQQKDNVGEGRKDGDPVDESNINWYSDDDDDDENRLTIKDDNEDIKEKDEETDEKSDTLVSPNQIKPQEVMEKLGDLSKIDISAEVTKLLTSMSQGRKFPATSESTISDTSTTTTATVSTTSIASNDPRVARQDPRTAPDKQESSRIDPRLSAPKQRSRQSSLDSQPKPEKVSIYEQGSIERSGPASDEADIDLRGMRSDVDLRNLQLPFKGMQNYTPASEIDGSLNSHEPIPWKLSLVEIPRPDYTGLKLSVSDAEKTGDPRLRKIFRLSTEERDTPLSPKASPKASQAAARVDPRLKKIEESKAEAPPPPGVMGYAQQLSALQSSPFYQNLTSNQKLLLNDEVSKLKGDPSEPNPVMSTLLGRLNIIPMPVGPSSPHLGQALNILSKLNYPMMNQGPPNSLPPHMGQNPNMMNQMGQNMNQPGLLGAAPGMPNMNMPPDYPMNFNPRNGLLGNAPQMGYGGFPPPDQQNNFNYGGDDFYPPDGGDNFQGNRSNRGFNRDRRRGRSFNHRGGGRGYRRSNRANRNHSPP